MQNIISIAQMVLAVLLIILVLMQGKGSGVSAVFGGSGNVYRTKRGAEKFFHISTIIVSILFFALSLAQLFV